MTFEYYKPSDNLMERIYGKELRNISDKQGIKEVIGLTLRRSTATVVSRNIANDISRILYIDEGKFAPEFADWFDQTMRFSLKDDYEAIADDLTAWARLNPNGDPMGIDYEFSGKQVYINAERRARK